MLMSPVLYIVVEDLALVALTIIEQMLITASEVKASGAHNLLEFIGVAAREVTS